MCDTTPLSASQSSPTSAIASPTFLPTAAGIDNSWTYRISKGLQVVAGCAPTAMVDVADADFFNYGFWLKRTTDEDGVLMYDEVETFAGSSIDASDSVAAVTGTAIATALARLVGVPWGSASSPPVTASTAAFRSSLSRLPGASPWVGPARCAGPTTRPTGLHLSWAAGRAATWCARSGSTPTIAPSR